MTAELVADGVWLVRDTCNVYLIQAPGTRTALTIDFGAGVVLDELEGLGIDRITDVLMTHHHRDQGQGLPLAVEHGARIHVPPVEVDLFDQVDEMWRDPSARQRLQPARGPVLAARAGAGHGVGARVPRVRYGGVRRAPVPTPGHTVGSVTYLLDLDGWRLAFIGDLITRPGKVWSLAATQWTYTEIEGPAMTVLGCYLLADERPGPAAAVARFGRWMTRPTLCALLAERCRRTSMHAAAPVGSRGPPARIRSVRVTEHLLLNRIEPVVPATRCCRAPARRCSSTSATT